MEKRNKGYERRKTRSKTGKGTEKQIWCFMWAEHSDMHYSLIKVSRGFCRRFIFLSSRRQNERILTILKRQTSEVFDWTPITAYPPLRHFNRSEKERCRYSFLTLKNLTLPVRSEDKCTVIQACKCQSIHEYLWNVSLTWAAFLMIINNSQQVSVKKECLSLRTHRDEHTEGCVHAHVKQNPIIQGRDHGRTVKMGSGCVMAAAPTHPRTVCCHHTLFHLAVSITLLTTLQLFTETKSLNHIWDSSIFLSVEGRLHGNIFNCEHKFCLSQFIKYNGQFY